MSASYVKPCAKWLVLLGGLLSINHATAQSTTFWTNSGVDEANNPLTRMVLNHGTGTVARTELGLLPVQTGDIGYSVSSSTLYGATFVGDWETAAPIYEINLTSPSASGPAIGYIDNTAFNNSLSADQFGNIWSLNGSGVVRYFQIADLTGSSLASPYAVPTFTTITGPLTDESTPTTLRPAGDTVRLGSALYTSWDALYEGTNTPYATYLFRTEVGTASTPIAGSSVAVGRLPYLSSYGLTNDIYGNLYVVADDASGPGLYRITLPAAPDDTANLALTFIPGTEGPTIPDTDPPASALWWGLTSDAEGLQATVTVRIVSINGTGTFSFGSDHAFTTEGITTATPGTPSSGATHYFDYSAPHLTLSTNGLPPGWTLTGVSCTGLGAGGTATPTVNGTAGGSILLDDVATPAGSNIVCTFVVTRASDVPTTTAVVPVNSAWALVLVALALLGVALPRSLRQP